MDNAFEDLQEVPVCDSVADAESVIATNDTWKNGQLQEASQKYDELNSLVQEMADLGSTENPYTTLTPEVREGEGEGEGEGGGGGGRGGGRIKSKEVKCVLFRMFIANGVLSWMLYLIMILSLTLSLRDKTVCLLITLSLSLPPSLPLSLSPSLPPSLSLSLICYHACLLCVTGCYMYSSQFHCIFINAIIVHILYPTRSPIHRMHIMYKGLSSCVQYYSACIHFLN